jgi:epoxyqueuosine reductase
MKKPGSLKSLIHEEALRLGFFKMGIASARLLPCPEHFRSWLQQGFQGTMSYIERQAPKRENPRLVLENARTIVVLAMNYHTMIAPAISSINGRISRYAWGEDYHGIVRARVKDLLDFIQSLAPSAKGISYVDTGPVMEKVWGAETALGWMGKHTNLITKERGSWFFIGVILLDFEIEADVQEKNYCGKCTRCILACPTGAIAAPYVLDARRCISYLTIELRGPIPRPLRSLIGNRIYGCDDCQEVCPWNKFATATSEKKFEPKRENLDLELSDLVRIDSVDFNSRFKDSPILRATRDGFVRNVAIALGNSGRDGAVPALETALCDRSPLVRSHAAWALGQIATENSQGILRKAALNEPDSDVFLEISQALECFKGANLSPNP